MQLSEIVSNVNAELGPATNIDTYIKKWANQGQNRFISLTNHQFSWMTLDRLTLTTVASQSEYALSPLVDTSKLIVMYSEDRRWRLTLMSRREFRDRFPDADLVEGDPVAAYLSGYTPFENQPTSASAIKLVSSDNNDTAVVVLDGLDANGVLIREEVTLTGVTPVSSTNTFTRMLGRSINGYLAGILTITSNADAVTNEVVSPRDRQGLKPKITFWPTPSDAKTIYYDACVKLTPLVSDNDFSLIPEPYHDAIEYYCNHRGYLHKKDFKSAAGYLQVFKERVMEAVANDTDAMEIVVNGGQRRNYLGEGSLPGLFPWGY